MTRDEFEELLNLKQEVILLKERISELENPKPKKRGRPKKVIERRLDYEIDGDETH